MEKFMEIYAEYHLLISSYCGSQTDWNNAFQKLSVLDKKCKKIKVRDGKNFYFYSWLKRSLCKEISEEVSRVYKICCDK